MDVVTKKCDGCQLKVPSYGLPSEGKKNRWCSGCAKGHAGADLIRVEAVGQRQVPQRHDRHPLQLLLVRRIFRLGRRPPVRHLHLPQNAALRNMILGTAVWVALATHHVQHLLERSRELLGAHLDPELSGSLRRGT